MRSNTIYCKVTSWALYRTLYPTITSKMNVSTSVSVEHPRQSYQSTLVVTNKPNNRDYRGKRVHIKGINEQLWGIEEGDVYNWCQHIKIILSSFFQTVTQGIQAIPAASTCWIKRDQLLPGRWFLPLTLLWIRDSATSCHVHSTSQRRKWYACSRN